MATAREIMTEGAECTGAAETVLEAARRMTRLGGGALPVCGTDDKLTGVLTDRDLDGVKAFGDADKDPTPVKVDELAHEAVTTDADDSGEEVLRTMSEHKVRRLPVMAWHRLAGFAAQADVGRALPGPKVGDLLEILSSD
ncbi:histidine kinase [Streptomyces cinnamoneus]|uniref:Histidine kinase n=1 Tax=Streptomyces cinnamoneus TaxID=53446 RepID=A0A2G1XL24_STRCJ|nr:CBS domain-containing protein [Streptomyces cinnamoneus]PHQ51927.1 histidine kinase [Streptomyces cinnamoneus]PPT11628.1 CBS domain-containing protein [Streptomyces cinnamoneus]